MPAIGGAAAAAPRTASAWARSRGRSGAGTPATSTSPVCGVVIDRYDDDEPGSPWSFFLYVDERGDEAQREALAGIFPGRLGGTPRDQFPWVWKASDLLGVRAGRDRDRPHARARLVPRRRRGPVRVREPVADQEPSPA